MAITVTYIGVGSIGGGAASSTTTPAYNQAAGHLIAVTTKIYSGSATVAYVTSVTDTAGNTYLPVFTTNAMHLATNSGIPTNLNGGGTGGTAADMYQVFYVANCLGNAANVITVNFSASSAYSGLAAWDIAGADTLDTASVCSNQLISTTGTNLTLDYTTTQENEAFILFGGTGTGGATFSAGTGITLDGNWTNSSDASGHVIFTSPQSAISANVFTMNTAETWHVHGVGFYKAIPAWGNMALSGVSTGGQIPVPVSVDLSSYYNREGIVTDGTTFSGSGGLDASGFALSATLLGSSIGPFTFGTANQNNAVSGTGQTITVPTGQYSSLLLLGIAVGTNQTGQTITANYSDSTSSSFTQSFSNWGTVNNNYTGESMFLGTAYRNASGGTTGAGTPYWLVCEYQFALTPTKNTVSVTLPNNANVVILAMVLVPN